MAQSLLPYLMLACSMALVLIAGRNLRHPGQHSTHRFFAFETALMLVLLNLTSQCGQPFAPLPLIAWLLLISSLSLESLGFRRLWHSGKPSKGIEATAFLDVNRVCRWIRYSLYASWLYFGWEFSQGANRDDGVAGGNLYIQSAADCRNRRSRKPG
jgi:hypothetical protein